MKDFVEKTLRLAATPERVWQAITEPAELSRWFPDHTDLEPRPGSTGWFDWTAYGKYAVRIEELSPPRRLVWTWARDAGVALEEGQRTTVEWTLEPSGDGGTNVYLRESGFTDPKYRDGNDEGWDKELGELVQYLEGRPAVSEAG
jgi:uncharacterized protein YndB with AHSA1/START domain